jgi:hypothetical protein
MMRMDSDSGIIENTRGSFVYSGPVTQRSQCSADKSSDAAFAPFQSVPSSSLVTMDRVPCVMSNFLLPVEIDSLSSISFVDKLLLHYFIDNASRAIACHPSVQQEVCRVVIPMALESPALFYATIALSAIHWKSLTSNDLDDLNGKKLIAGLKAASLRHLREELESLDGKHSDNLLATARTLFLCEVHAGGDRPRTWRAHFEGAKALIVALESNSPSWTSNQHSSRQFLRRWYSVTEALVALTADGLSKGQLTEFGPSALIAEGSDDAYLDVYTGCSTDLSLVFREIGAVAWERRRAMTDPHHIRFLDDDFKREADWLEQSVRRMMERSKIQPPIFDVTVSGSVSPQQANEFILCNEAYQHTALIHIHRRVRNLHPSSPEVQSSVKRIIDCIDGIIPAPGLSPLVVLTTPLFTAGCEALASDRDAVRRLLRNMFDLLRIPNVRRALEVLEAFWERSRCGNNDKAWEDFMRTISSGLKKTLISDS